MVGYKVVGKIDLLKYLLQKYPPEFTKGETEIQKMDIDQDNEYIVLDSGLSDNKVCDFCSISNFHIGIHSLIH